MDEPFWEIEEQDSPTEAEEAFAALVAGDAPPEPGENDGEYQRQ